MVEIEKKYLVKNKKLVCKDLWYLYIYIHKYNFKINLNYQNAFDILPICLVLCYYRNSLLAKCKITDQVVKLLNFCKISFSDLIFVLN